MTRFKLLHFYRGVAAVLVILVHLTQIFKDRLSVTLFNNIFIVSNIGNLGVDFFFVLSGFIITYSHYYQIGKKQLLSRYLKKRFIRIFPLYWMVVIGTIILYSASGKNIFQLLKITLSRFMNILLLLPSSPHPLPQAWSLSYELLFYSFFCIYFFIPTQTYFFALLGLIGSCILAVNFIPFLSLFIPYLGIVIFDFCIGSVGALVFQTCAKKSINTKLPIYVSFIIIIISWCFYTFLFNNGITINNNLRVFIFGIPLGVIVLFSSLFEAKHSVKWVHNFLWLGDISYSLFLVHFMLIVFLVNIIKRIRIMYINQYVVYLSVVLIFFLTLAVAWLLHFTIEKPVAKYLAKVMRP